MARRGEKTEEPGIYRLEDDRYRVVVSATDPDTGKRVQRQKTLQEGQTMAEAAQIRETLREEIRTPEGTKTRTLADFTEQWIERKAKRVKPKTARTYASAVEDRLMPVEVDHDGRRVPLGEIPVDEVSRRHVKQWRDAVESWTRRVKVDEDDDGEPVYERKPYSTSTTRKWWRVFGDILRELHADGYIDADPTYRMDPPETGRSGVRDEEALSRDELHELVEATREVAEQRYLEVALLAYTGMRSGELWALKWPDIDYERGVIVVRRSVSDGQVVDKTKAGYDREVPMPDSLTADLRQHRREMLADQHPGLETGLVFPSQAGTPRGPGSINASLANAADEAGIERAPTPQTLRKTFVTLLTDAQIDRTVMRAIVGHRSEEMTEHYASHRLERRREVVNSLLEQGGSAE